MIITILYDNEAQGEGLQADWGFAALIEAHGHTILFDTGANASVLLGNMDALNISIDSLEEIFISHDHWDHTGGLPAILERRPVPVYVPDTIARVPLAGETVVIDEPMEIHENIYSTGTLKNIEQSLCIRQDDNIIVIVGCSHPGVKTILEAASLFGRATALIGGLHGFTDFAALDALDPICPTHCTQHQQAIRSRFPRTAIDGGAGKTIRI